jgi:hypothetical protein
MKSTSKPLLKALAKLVKAGPGAGVTVSIEGSFDLENKGTDEDPEIHFKPSLVEVEFQSAYDTQRAKKGLKVQLETLTGGLAQDFWSRYDSVSLSVNHKMKLMESGETFRALVLSGGWVRTSHEKGDVFDFDIQVDPNYNISIPATAEFTEAGEDAWADLDNSDDVDIED